MSNDATANDTTEQAAPATGWRDQTFSLAEYPEKLAIVKLPAGAEIPQWAESASLFSVTATATETSLICAGRSVPLKTPSIRPLKAFRVVGDLDSSAVGVLASLLIPIADLGVPVYTFSTHETDWIMVRVVDTDAVAEAWRAEGHSVTAAVPIEAQRKPKADQTKAGKTGKKSSKKDPKK